MYVTGFSESVAELLGFQSQWAVRGFSVAVLVALLGINLAGVKWIVRLQLLLLAVLAVSTLDFIVGTFSHLDPEHGFVGYSSELLGENSLPDYSPGDTFFTIFGVFFPAATGVMAGFNMSLDLQRPEQNIPLGTLAALFTSWFLYLVFVFLLGAICTREALRYDFLIAEKVSLVGFLFLLGLYVSSLASCMGGLYGAPRILQCIAQERVIPALAFLGKGKGPNKTPVAAICLTSLLTMAFVFIGQVNELAPIVTINFMFTYSFIDYCYFSMDMTYQLQIREKKNALTQAKRSHLGSARQSSSPLLEVTHQRYDSQRESSPGKGTLLEFAKDMECIFPPVPSGDGAEKMPTGLSNRATIRTKVPAKQTLMDSFGLDLNSSVFPGEKDQNVAAAPPGEAVESRGRAGELGPGAVESRGRAGQLGPGAVESQGRVDPQVKSSVRPSHGELDLPAGRHNHNTGAISKPEYQGSEIKPIPDSFYAKFCNNWVALIGALCSVLIMFVIQWVYALINITVALLLFIYIGKTSPGLPIGTAARFSFLRWLRSTLSSVGRRECSSRDQIVVTPSLSGVDVKTKQLTEQNADFASRHPHHQSFFITVDRMVQPQQLH